jgi:hypothetical protein
MNFAEPYCVLSTVFHDDRVLHIMFSESSSLKTIYLRFYRILDFPILLFSQAFFFFGLVNLGRNAVC